MVSGSPFSPPSPQDSLLLHASALGGSAMLRNDGQALGTVVDLVVDCKCGTVAYVVVASGGFMGMGEMRYALPWSSVSAIAGSRHFHCREGRLLERYRLQ